MNVTQPKFYIDSSNSYIGSFSGIIDINGEIIEFPEIPNGAIEVPTAPDDARQKWDNVNKAWLPLEN